MFQFHVTGSELCIILIFAQSSDETYSNAIGQIFMTIKTLTDENEICPAQALLKLLSGKCKPEIFRLAVDGPLRFSSLLQQIQGANKQTLSVALKELEEANILKKEIISAKPLHIEYALTEHGRAFVPVLQQLEDPGKGS